MKAPWIEGPCPPPGLFADVHVWRADLDAEPRPDVSLLPADERRRAAGLRVQLGRERWVAARWALRRVLARYLQEDPAGIRLRLGARGKPALASVPPRLRFNLSHSGGLALIAVSGEVEVGVDVEQIDPGREVLGLAEVGLGPEAAAAVRGAPAQSRSAAFHRAWVRREAIAKCHGVGLGTPVPRSPASVTAIGAGPDYPAAVAVAAPEPPGLRTFALGAV